MTVARAAELLEHFAAIVDDDYAATTAQNTADALRTHAALLADLRHALRAYDLAGPLTETRRAALGKVLTLARQLTEE